LKIRISLALVAALSLAIAAVAYAAPSEYKITGGGQTLLTATSSETQGPGDTVTFQAFIPTTGLNETSTGHVNVIDRAEGGGGKGVHYKGDVTCSFLVTDGLGGGYAELYGTATTKAGTPVDFVLRIRDNGQGDAAEPDMVEFDTTDPEQCGENDEEEEPGFFLARGNAKIHKASPSNGGGGKSAKSTSLLALR
jgi:hypothetical protein